MDARGIGKQPKLNSNRNWMVYFFVYGILAHFLIINIIFAVLVEKYISSKQKLGKDWIEEFLIELF